MSKWDDEQRRLMQNDQQNRMRPSNPTGVGGAPNPHYRKPTSSSGHGGPGSGGGCFPAGTRVDTPDGPRDISAMRAGELIVTVDERTGTQSVGRVLKVQTHMRRRLWRLTLEDGPDLLTTSVHAFLVDGQWRPARRLAAGDRLAFVDGTRLTTRVVTASGEAGAAADVYNLIVAGPCTYVANGAVAHSFTRFRETRKLFWRIAAALMSAPSTCRDALHVAVSLSGSASRSPAARRTSLLLACLVATRS
jgi:hypothetical protein